MSKQALLLGVNVDHCATLRNARHKDKVQTCGGVVEPDPVFLASMSELAGADSITVHLREDRRHMQEQDIFRMRESIHVPLNLEMACTEEMLDYALKLKPDYVCLVPEKREEVTTEGGLEIVAQKAKIESMVKPLRDAGIIVSLFIDPDLSQIQASVDVGAEFIELHTGAFANDWHKPLNREKRLQELKLAAEFAHEKGLKVNAGHGINYHNIKDICKLPHLHELNIGHSIISRALFVGIKDAVREMKELIK